MVPLAMMEIFVRLAIPVPTEYVLELLLYVKPLTVVTSWELVILLLVDVRIPSNPMACLVLPKTLVFQPPDVQMESVLVELPSRVPLSLSVRFLLVVTLSRVARTRMHPTVFLAMTIILVHLTKLAKTANVWEFLHQVPLVRMETLVPQEMFATEMESVSLALQLLVTPSVLVTMPFVILVRDPVPIQSKKMVLPVPTITLVPLEILVKMAAVKVEQ